MTDKKINNTDNKSEKKNEDEKKYIKKICKNFTICNCCKYDSIYINGKYYKI